MEFLKNADPYYEIVFYIGIGSFIVFMVQSLLSFFGTDAFSDGTHADFDGDLQGHFGPMQMFTFRNFINFLLGFSWTAIALYEIIPNKPILSLIATAVGLLLVITVLFLMAALQRLAEDKTMKLEHAIGKTGTVYLTIPSHKSGKGKIHITIQDTLRELDAMTDGAAIPTNTLIVVESIIQNSILIVKKA